VDVSLESDTEGTIDGSLSGRALGVSDGTAEDLIEGRLL